jgi:hypothetical protein
MEGTQRRSRHLLLSPLVIATVHEDDDGKTAAGRKR